MEPIIAPVPLLHILPGSNIKHPPEEHVRPFLAKALEQAYSRVLEDMQADFRVGGGKSRRRSDIALFHPKREHSTLNLSRAVICRPISGKVVDDVPVIGAAYDTLRERTSESGR